MPTPTTPTPPEATAFASPEATSSPHRRRPAGSAPAEAVTPLLRGVSVLLRLTEAGGRLSPSDLEHATGLARSTVDRITATLARMGYVRLDGRDAVLTPRVMDLGNAYLSALRIPALLNPPANALADELDESVSLAVADLDGIRFVHQATRRRAMSLSFRIGDLLPAERTAPGPLFATEWTADDWRAWRSRRETDPRGTAFPAVPPRPGTLPVPDFAARAGEAARTGWSLDDQLIEPGLVAVSVPVRCPDSHRIACVASVVSHTSRHTAQDLRQALLPRLRAAVAEMEEILRTAPPPAGRPPTDLAVWTAASKQELGRGFIESLARGLTVLTAFGEGRSAPTLTEVAKATGLARATARRALITYEHLGLVRAEQNTFRPTPRVLSLGYPPLSRATLAQMAAPHLAELSVRIQESTALAVLVPPHPGSGGPEATPEIQYPVWVSAPHVMSVRMPPGTRVPARATAAGRILTAPGDTRATPPAHALVDGELEKGLRSIAVPVHDRTGRAVAAVSAAMHAARHTEHACVKDILPALTEAATRITTDLRTASRFTDVPLS